MAVLTPAKVPKHVSIQFGRKNTSSFTLDRLTFSSLVLLQARAFGQIQVLLAGRVRYIYFSRQACSLKIPLRPDITFFCDLDFDPFLFMQDNEKVYGMHTSDYLISQLSARRLYHHPSRVRRDYRNTLADRKRYLSFIHPKKHIPYNSFKLL